MPIATNTTLPNGSNYRKGTEHANKYNPRNTYLKSIGLKRNPFGSLAAEDDRQAELFAAMSRAFARPAAATMRESVRPLVSGFAPLGDAQATAAAEALTAVITDRFTPNDLAGLWTDMVDVGQQLKEMD